MLCSTCGTSSELGNSKVAKGRKRSAIWSLVCSAACIALSIASAVLTGLSPVAGLVASIVCILSGFAALILAARAIYWMRYVKTGPFTKIAIAAGSVGTGCFGVPLGGFALLGALILTVISVSTTEFQSPGEAAKLSQEMFQIAIPEKLEARNGSRSSLNFGRVTYLNHEKRNEATTFLRVDWYPGALTMNKGQFQDIVARNGNEAFDSRLYPIDKMELTWKIEEKDAMVFRRELENRDTSEKSVEAETEKSEPDDQDVADEQDEVANETTLLYVQYYTLFDVEHLTFGLSLVYDPNKVDLTESDVQKIFESFKMAE